MITLDRLETQKQDLLTVVDGWPENRLLYRPSPGCWCVAEVFDHLVKTEERILEAAKHGLPKPHRVGFTDRARTRFLREIFKTNRRVKVPPTATVVLPDDAPQMNTVLERWRSVRIELGSFYASLSPLQMRQGIFKHPVGGWMAMPDVVEFFYVHMLHHVFQLSRLREESQNL